MRTYISPIGYDSRRVTRPVLSYGLDTGDKVILLQPSNAGDDSRAQETMKEVEKLVGQIEPDVEIETEEIEYDNLDGAVFDCVDVLQESSGEVIVSFGGGARDILLPFIISVLANMHLVDRVLQFSDIDGDVREHTLPVLTTDIPEKAWRTVSAIYDSDGGITIAELEEELDLSKSTITRHINELENKNVVSSELSGKKKEMQLTFTGELLLASTRTV